MSCRAIWRADDRNLAKDLIVSKRMSMDDALAQKEGIHFFISALTGTNTNARESRQGEQNPEATEKEELTQAGQSIEATENSDKEMLSDKSEAEDEEEKPLIVTSFFNPGVAYFVAYSPLEDCSVESIVRLLHNEDTEANVKSINTHVSFAEEEKATARLAKELSVVVKDHKNFAVQQLASDSARFCYTKKIASIATHWTRDKVERAFENGETPTQMAKKYQTHVRIVVVNPNVLEDVRRAALQLDKDGLQFRLVELVKENATAPMVAQPSSDLFMTIERLNRAMQKFQHILYKGSVYGMPKAARFTYVEMMTVEKYLNKMLASKVMREGIGKHMGNLIKMMSTDACEIFKQMTIDFNLIEVKDGMFFDIRKRKFIECPLGPEQKGTISPRMFIDFDSKLESDAKYFKEGIMNSFEEDQERAMFLNKFYQCLMAHKMPHKIRKLVVFGPKDSGKTSWLNVLLGVIPSKRVAAITSEKQFAASMIDENTELVFMDEWSENTLNSDMAKTVLQGGMMVKSIKHQSPSIVDNSSPFYITTNCVPHFGIEEENVRRRITCFETESLPSTVVGADKWMRKNSMACIRWMASEITKYRDFIEPEELWYEEQIQKESEDPDFANGGGKDLLDIKTLEDLQEADVSSGVRIMAAEEPNYIAPVCFIHPDLQADAVEISNQASTELEEEDRLLGLLDNLQETSVTDNSNTAIHQVQSNLLQQTNDLPTTSNEEVATRYVSSCQYQPLSEGEESDDEIPCAQPEQTAELNSYSFYRQVKCQLENSFFEKRPLTYTHKCIAKARLEREEMPSHIAESWRLVMGEFGNINSEEFFDKYPHIIDVIQNLREKIGIRLVRSSPASQGEPVFVAARRLRETKRSLEDIAETSQPKKTKHKN